MYCRARLLEKVLGASLHLIQNFSHALQLWQNHGIITMVRLLPVQLGTRLIKSSFSFFPSIFFCACCSYSTFLHLFFSLLAIFGCDFLIRFLKFFFFFVARGLFCADSVSLVVLAHRFIDLISAIFTFNTNFMYTSCSSALDCFVSNALVVSGGSNRTLD